MAVGLPMDALSAALTVLLLVVLGVGVGIAGWRRLECEMWMGDVGIGSGANRRADKLCSRTDPAGCWRNGTAEPTMADSV